MNSQQEQFLNLKTLPARVRAEDAALLLGFSAHEIPILAAHGLIKPLGHPLPTGVKFFSVVMLEELRKDVKWLARASDCIVDYWKNVNQNRKKAHRDKNHSAPNGRASFKRELSSLELPSARRAPVEME